MDSMHSNLGSFTISDDGAAAGFAYAMVNERSARQSDDFDHYGVQITSDEADNSALFAVIITIIIAVGAWLTLAI